MPRPKVPASQRQRAAEACNFCRASKKRCSATVPCTACKKRGIEASCYLTHKPWGTRRTRENVRTRRGNGGSGSSVNPATTPPVVAADVESSRRSPRHEATEHPGRHGRLSERHASLPPETTLWSPGSSRNEGVDEYRPLSPSESRVDSPADAPSSRRLSSGHDPHARMLLNLRGNRVFIGEAASISFLQFLRDTVEEQMGPSLFTRNDKSQSMLESAPTVSESETAAGDQEVGRLDREEALEYYSVYRVVTGGFLDVLASTETDALLNGSHPPSNGSLTILELVTALGAQCKSPNAALTVGRQCFRRAQRRAFSGMLEDPDVDMVRAFVLMTFYMLGHCRRNTAFLYLGIATRAAVALGLHRRESFADLDREEDNLGLRVWLSLCIVDMLVSAILGRPPATLSLRSEVDRELTSPSTAATDADVVCLAASYRIASIINAAAHELYGKQAVAHSAAERLLEDVDAWKRTLPDCLKTQGSSVGGTRAETVRNVHVSCLYYFAVTLVTRPVLVATLSAREVDSEAEASGQMASACVDAALYLIQTCKDAHRMGYLVGNMCIMKALLFAAGLILGFVMVAERNADYEVERAIRSAKEILASLAAQSPQAAHYSEMLGLLLVAIETSRGRLAARGGNKYVGRLFTLDGANEAIQGSLGTEGEAVADAGEGIQGMGLGGGGDEGGGVWVGFQQQLAEIDADFLSGWDALDLSQWDSFPFLGPRSFCVD